MSLVSTAAIWSNDDIPNKKRTPTMRKTIKTTPNEYTTKNDELYEYKNSQEDSTVIMQTVEQDNEDRSTKINQILNQMSSVSIENDGNNLADFNPPPNPSIHIKKDLQKEWVKSEEPIPDLQNELQLPTTSFYNKMNPYLVSNNSISNYHTVYDGTAMENKPYYNKMGITVNSNTNNDKLMEKINYLIHMIENQEYEKTANVTEEFILYTFLGVFIIFVLDSFSRSGKYVR